MEDEDEEELVERLECEIEMEKGRWKWRRVCGEIRMRDRVSGKIRMGDRWVGYKRKKKWAWEGKFFWRENFGCLRGFWKIEEKFERMKIPKRERILKMMGV